MQRYSGSTVLICEECGKRMVLTDPEVLIWRSKRPVFDCDCGKKLTLDNRIVEGSPVAGGAHCDSE
jgi:hypothetical protein